MRPWQALARRIRLATFVSTMVPTLAALGLQLVTFAITARGLGVAQFGQYTALVAIVGVAVELVGLGSGDLLVRAVAIDKRRHGVYFAAVLAWSGLTLPLVLLVSVALAIGPMWVPLDAWHISLALLGEVMMARTLATAELIMVAQQHVARAGWLRLATFGTRLMLAVLVFVGWGQHDLRVWIEAVAVQALLVTVALIALVWHLYGRPVWTLPWAEVGQGTTFALNQTSRAMQSNMDRMILSRFADSTALGAYGAATRIIQLGLFPIQVVTRILYPRFFQHGVHGLVAVRAFALRTAAPALLGVGVLSGVMVALAGTLAPLVLGADFASAVDTTWQLAWALPFIALQYPAADALTASGRQWIRAVVSTSSAAGFGFLLVAGAHWGGAQGVAMGFVAGHAVLAAVLWVAVFRCADDNV